MPFTPLSRPDPRLADLIAQGLARFGVYPTGADARWLLVDVAGQRLILVERDRPLGAWPVSTARAGVDARQDSGGTPPGAHRIARRIGLDAAPGTVFVSREPTGETWCPGDQPRDDDLILTRVLTLDGCEPGVNSGPGVDSLARYIYLHGTNHEDRLGEPVSHGCIRLGNADVVDVCDRVREGDPVVIV
ncbi:L,D-transpeptidase, partial [bacterium]|nr:L,D-transpeptidase [bacterium]